MVLVSIEEVTIDNSKDVIVFTKGYAEGILNDNFNNLKEIIITGNYENSLEKRMLPDKFSEYKGTLAHRKFPSGGKTIRIIENESIFSIVIANCENLANYYQPVLTHELYHVNDFVFFDKYLLDSKLSKEELDYISGLKYFISEYNGCRAEESARNYFKVGEWLEDFDLEKMAKHIIDKFKLLSKSDEVTFQKGIKMAIGEFNSIFVRHLGYRDAAKDEDLFNKEIRTGLVYDLFEDSLLLLAESIRNFDTETDVIKEAKEFWNLGNLQTDYFNKNIFKVI